MYTYSSAPDAFGVALLIVLAVYGIIMLVALAVGIVTIIAYWKLFEKAGVEGWKAIIPYYNTFKIAQIATGNDLIGWLTVGASAASVVISVLIQVAQVFVGTDNITASIFVIIFSLISMAVSLALAGLSGYTHFMLGKSFGKSTVWNVLMIFFPFFLVIAMGFDKNLTYVGPKGEPTNYYY